MYSKMALAFWVSLMVPATALAYIDPGTTGMVVGGAAGVLAWGVLLLTLLRRKVVAVARFVGRSFVRHPFVSLAVLALPSSAAALAWMMMKSEREVNAAMVTGDRFQRVLLIGLDGVDPKDVRALIDKKMLPNFAKLATAGFFGPMAITNPAESPVVWSTLATGQNPGRHGVFDFIGRDPASYLPKLAVLKQDSSGYSPPIEATTFWEVTAKAGMPTTVIRWPLTFPSRPFNGKILAGLGVPDLRGGLGRYSYFTDREVKDDEEGRDKIVRVDTSGGRFKAELVGPKKKGLTGLSDMTTPFEVEIGSDKKSAVLSLGKKRYVLQQGRWSDWVDVSFSSGLFAKARGLVKMYLESAADPFALYVSSVEIHPDEPVFAFTHPPEYSAELRKKIGLYHTLGMPEDTKAYGDGHLSEAAFFEECQSVEAERRAMMTTELEHFDRGVLAVVFDTSDRIQHMTPIPSDITASAIGRYLIEFDRFLGGVLAKLPAQTPVIIFSDHGFSHFEHAVDLNRWLVANGYLAIDEEAFAQRAAGDNGELYKFVDWSRSRAYAVGFSGIYINVKGREGQGVVEPEQRRALAQEIGDKLRALKDGDKDVVHGAYLGDDLYQGVHHSEGPDLIVGFVPGYRGSWQSAVGGLAAEVISDNDKLWQRDHIVDPEFVPGTLITNFKVNVSQPRVDDLAPTVLGLLGLEPPEEMEGRVLHRATHKEVAVHTQP